MILVTGAAGFIGSRVARRLVEMGRPVRCLVRASTDLARIRELPVELFRADVRDAVAVRGAMEGVTSVVHLASIVAWDKLHDPALEKTIVEGTLNVAHAARAAGVSRLVHVSSTLAINGSREPIVFDESAPFELLGTRMRYAIAKHQAEVQLRRLAEQGLPVVIVNPAEVYGPGDTMLVTAGNLLSFLCDRVCIACAGGTAIVHVDDVANGIVRALDHGRAGERYILGGENLSVRELISLTHDLARTIRPVLQVPNALALGLARAVTALRLPSPVPPVLVEYATRYYYVTSAKAARDLGYSWRPARAVLASTLEWLTEAGYL